MSEISWGNSFSDNGLQVIEVLCGPNDIGHIFVSEPLRLLLAITRVYEGENVDGTDSCFYFEWVSSKRSTNAKAVCFLPPSSMRQVLCKVPFLHILLVSCDLCQFWILKAQNPILGYLESSSCNIDLIINRIWIHFTDFSNNMVFEGDSFFCMKYESI